jgi:hypothetical protein
MIFCFFILTAFVELLWSRADKKLPFWSTWHGVRVAKKKLLWCSKMEFLVWQYRNRNLKKLKLLKFDEMMKITQSTGLVQLFI